MLPFWNESPFVRITVPFIIGITFYLLFPSYQIFSALGALLFCGVCIFSIRFTSDYFKLTYAYLKGLLINAFIITFGYALTLIHQDAASTQWYKHHVSKYPFALVKIDETPEPKQKTIKAIVQVLGLYDSTASISTCGKAILYFQKGKEVESIKQGDKLLIKNTFKDIKSSANPGSFDYASYCKTKNIFQTAFLKIDEWKKTPLHTEDYKTLFAAMNTDARNVLKKYLPDSSTHGVAEALLLGYRLDISEETWRDYSNTGIVHIIAISGMHMAMVYGSIRWLLLLVPIFKKRKNLAILFAIISMWWFALLTGLPASVGRAAVMFTFIAWGEMQNQKINALNMLSASAFCMLCINPQLLLDVGFQLSYLAVMSLVFFYEPIYKFIFVGNRFVDAVWRLLAATLAAQILTFPLCIYYFHQFPVLFLATNLFAVPLTTLILYAEILLIWFQVLTPIATFTGSLISHLICFVNQVVALFGNLGYAVWSEIQISVLQMVLLFLIIGCLAQWLLRKRPSFLMYTLSIVALFCVTLVIRQYKIFTQKKVLVYHVANQKSIEFISGSAFMNPDIDDMIQKEKNTKYTFHPAHIYFGVRNAKMPIVSHAGKGGIELFSFMGKRVMRIENNHFHTSNPLPIDLLILSNKCWLDATWLTKNLRVTQIILDGSVPFWKIKKLQHQLKSLNIPIHVTSEQGAFVMNI